MSEGIAVKEREHSRGRVCQHHWVIQAPNGATSQGICKRCGASREFPNAAADALWQRETLGRWSRAGRPVEIKLPAAEQEDHD